MNAGAGAGAGWWTHTRGWVIEVPALVLCGSGCLHCLLALACMQRVYRARRRRQRIRRAQAAGMLEQLYQPRTGVINEVPVPVARMSLSGRAFDDDDEEEEEADVTL